MDAQSGLVTLDFYFAFHVILHVLRGLPFNVAGFKGPMKFGFAPRACECRTGGTKGGVVKL